MNNVWTLKFHQPKESKVRERHLFITPGDGSGFVPFETKRRFYLPNPGPYTLTAIHNDGHAHRKGWQLHTCTSGEATFHTEDGHERKDFTLKAIDGDALVIGPLVWHSYTLGPGASVYVEASLPYSEEDYIRNYDEFMATVMPHRLVP